MSQQPSSLGVNYDACSSNPHSSRPYATSTSAQDYRLSHARPSNEHVTHRLQYGQTYDHQARAADNINAFTTRFSSSSSASRRT
ncbi:hypothetical protein F4780DRAFT_784034 [Xylariomycetidae sp. FL0641]|nr:hypothetical protein F4780DRAFT_784034 [Xylariomycetidae sp. FL0641]